LYNFVNGAVTGLPQGDLDLEKTTVYKVKHFKYKYATGYKRIKGLDRLFNLWKARHVCVNSLFNVQPTCGLMINKVLLEPLILPHKILHIIATSCFRSLLESQGQCYQATVSCQIIGGLDGRFRCVL